MTNKSKNIGSSYWNIVWNQFKKSKLGLASLVLFCLFICVGIYAPFLASSKPLFVIYQDHYYFPLFRYLLYEGFYSKKLDLFYNALIITFPLALLCLIFFKKKLLKIALFTCLFLQIALFGLSLSGLVKDPASNSQLSSARAVALNKKLYTHDDPLLSGFKAFPDWNFDLQYMNNYEKLNLILRYQERRNQNEKLKPYADEYFEKTGNVMPTLWQVDLRNYENEIQRLTKNLDSKKNQYQEALLNYTDLLEQYRLLAAELQIAEKNEKIEKSTKSTEHLKKIQKKILPTKNKLQETKKFIQDYRDSAAKLIYIQQRRAWLEKESGKLDFVIMPLIRPFHWQDDAGGEQKINQYVPWWDLSRINRKDLVSALIFGIRISLVVGVTAVVLALAIGIPIGTLSGYFAGVWDIVIFRLIEIWEAMPVFFMLLLIVAITQSKSIFLVIVTIGIFGWTTFSRFIRGEVLKQRNLSYVLACHNLGFSHSRIMFSHILPNAIPPILTLLPFSMMSAITSEAALSFLGLGEEGSCSWGVLMDEGRSVFPAESYLLWPPALLLTLLLISIAIVGDSLRDAIDPKLRT